MFCALLGHTGELLQDHWSSGFIFENKGANQLCGSTEQLRSHRAVDQCLCFLYIEQFPYFLNPKFQASS